MPSGDHLHLKEVLQAVFVLESVILRSFGPEGGQVLFTRDTGQTMLSRSGSRIITALRLEHPVARMVVECVLKHSTATGDGSKSFILLLASLLRMIHAKAFKETNASHTYISKEAVDAATARRLADELLAFAVEELDDVIAMGVAPYGHFLSWEDCSGSAHANNHYVRKLLASFFHSRLGHTHCDFMSDLTDDLLRRCRFKNGQHSSPLQFVNDNFPAFHTPVSGFPISCSRLIEGQVIHRDFATPCPRTDNQPVKAAVFTGFLQPKLLHAGEVLQLGGGEQERERSIMQFNAWTERSLVCIIAKLQSLGVSVLLTAVKQSAAVLALAAQADMSVVECISEDELFLFAQLSGTRPVSDCWTIEPEHVATLTFCRPILLGAHRYVHVGFHESEESAIFKPCSLVICGAGQGQTDQCACAFQDAIRMLRSAWEPMGTSVAASKKSLHSNKRISVHTDDQMHSTPTVESACVLPAGGSFEFLLNHALLQHGHRCSVSVGPNASVPVVSRLLANALLCVPRQIYSHSPKRFLQTQTRLLTFIQNRLHPVSFAYKEDDNSALMQGQGKNKRPLEEGKEGTHCCREPCVPSEGFLLNSGLESVSCKHQLLLAVLQCLSSLLRVDAVLHTRINLHSQSQRRANISWEGSEDEGED